MATKVQYDFDPLEDLDVELTNDQKDRLLEGVSDYLLESILSDVGDARSPVSGRAFPKLSAEYAKEVGRKIATLELTGDLLDSVQVVRKGNRLRVTVPEDEQGKADGHNNFSGESALPLRQFIPDAAKDQTFRPAIKAGIKEVIQDFLEEEGLV